MGLLFKSQLQKNIEFKQKERDNRIAALSDYKKPLTQLEQKIIGNSVSNVVQKVQNGELTPRDVLKAYGKAALISQSKTNAVTEVMIKDAEKWADESNTSGPLAGFPVSLKDPLQVKGYDALAGFAALADKPCPQDGANVKLIRDLGGYPFVKTNIPATMMSIMGYNDTWGRTVNPHNPRFAPGGSSQGEGALIGSGGARIGVGTDIAGSVRVPAAWCGINSLRMTSHRFPMDGGRSSGFEGIVGVASPMARTLGDLRYFIEAVFSADPWKYDYSLVPFQWRSDAKLPEKPRVGVMRLNDMLPLTPAQDRALTTATEALKKDGCEVVEFKTPVPAEEYELAVLKLFSADGMSGPGRMLMKGEHNEPFGKMVMRYVKLPAVIRYAWVFLLRLFGYKESANMFEQFRKLSASEYFQAVAKRDELRASFRKVWNDLDLDFLITAVHPSPALPNGTHSSFHTILYTSMFNLLDYPAGVVPVSRVQPSIDQVPKSFDKSKLTMRGKIPFRTYDAEKMAGLPTAIQVVGMRYHDEETLIAMERVTEALKKIGTVYK